MFDKLTLERALLRMRETASELKGIAPLASMRASALAREIQLKIEELER